MFDSNVKWHSLGRIDTRFIACPRNHRRPVVAAAGAASAVAAKSNPETMPHSSSKSRINEVVVFVVAIDALTPTSTNMNSEIGSGIGIWIVIGICIKSHIEGDVNVNININIKVFMRLLRPLIDPATPTPSTSRTDKSPSEPESGFGCAESDRGVAAVG